MSVKVASEALQAALRDVTGASARTRKVSDGRVRAVIRSGGQTFEFEVVFAGEGWPTEVREALTEVPKPWPRNLVISARSFSPGSLSLLREADANWVDLTGRARLVNPPLTFIRDLSKERTSKPIAGFRWSRSAVQIVEFVLDRRLSELRTGKLSEQTGWSPGQVSKLLRALDAERWTERRGGRSGLRTWHELVKPGVLLEAWAEEVSKTSHQSRLGHRTDRDLLRFAHMELESAFKGTRGGWALTTWAGVQLVTPYLTAVPVLHVYVTEDRFSRDLDRVMERAQIREVEEGARIEFWRADFPLRTHPGKPHPLPVISTPRLYADLMKLGGRGADAAQHLRETVLGY